MPTLKLDDAVKVPAPATLAESLTALGKALRVDAKAIPAVVEAKSVPTKRYWIGCVKGSPYQVMYCAGQDFPFTTDHRVLNEEGTQSMPLPVLGVVRNLTDEQVRMIMDESVHQAWRPRREKPDRTAAWEKINLHDVRQALRPGDRMTAHFIYMYELAPNENPPQGVRGLDGKELKTPDTLA